MPVTIHPEFLTQYLVYRCHVSVFCPPLLHRLEDQRQEVAVGGEGARDPRFRILLVVITYDLPTLMRGIRTRPCHEPFPGILWQWSRLRLNQPGDGEGEVRASQLGQCFQSSGSI